MRTRVAEVENVYHNGAGVCPHFTSRLMEGKRRAQLNRSYLLRALSHHPSPLLTLTQSQAQMQQMAASMGGAGMPPGAAEQMKNMTADDMKRAAQEMGNMDTDTLKNQYSAAMNQQHPSPLLTLTQSQAQMQQMAASMGGAGMPPGAAEQMKNMTADDMKRAAQEMGNMDTDTLKNQYSAAMNQQKAQSEYQLRGAEQLKKEGNALVGQGKYTEAIEKYMRVKNNLKDDKTAGAIALRTSCMLNMSLCFNKTSRFNSAISECAEVLKSDGKSLKAYYRRGQAYAFKKEFKPAVADLRRALALSPGDETVKAEVEKAVSDLIANVQRF